MRIGTCLPTPISPTPILPTSGQIVVFLKNDMKGSEPEWANQKQTTSQVITGNIRNHTYNCWTYPMVGVPQEMFCEGFLA